MTRAPQHRRDPDRDHTRPAHEQLADARRQLDEQHAYLTAIGHLEQFATWVLAYRERLARSVKGSPPGTSWRWRGRVDELHPPQRGAASAPGVPPPRTARPLAPGEVPPDVHD